MKKLVLLFIVLAFASSVYATYNISFEGQLYEGSTLISDDANLTAVVTNSSSDVVFNYTWINITKDSNSRVFEFINYTYDNHDLVYIQWAINNDTLSSKRFVGWSFYAIEAAHLNGRNWTDIETAISNSNTSVKTWVTSQIILANTSMKTYVDAQDTVYNDSMKTYVDTIKKGNTSEEIALMMNNATIARTNKNNNFGTNNITAGTGFFDFLGSVGNWIDEAWIGILHFTNIYGGNITADYINNVTISTDGQNITIGSGNYSAPRVCIPLNDSFVCFQKEIIEFDGVEYNITDLNWSITNETIFTVVDNGTFLNLADQRYNDTAFVIISNTSMKNYVDAQDILTNSSMKTYVDAQDVIYNNSLNAYVPYTGATSNVDLGSKNITADNYDGISIKAGNDQINYSIDGGTDLTNVSKLYLGTGTNDYIQHSLIQPDYFRMHGEEGSAMSSSYASGAVLGEQWSVGNGQTGLANEIAICDGEFISVGIQCRTAGAGVGVVALTINTNGVSSEVLPCNVTTTGTLAPGLTICDSGSAPFSYGDDLRFRTMVTDTSAICSVFAHARCY